MNDSTRFQFRTTVITVTSPQVILDPTLRTIRGELATGHGNEGPVVALDNFEIPDDETVIESYATKSAQAIFRTLHEFYSDFCDFQSTLLLLGYSATSSCYVDIGTESLAVQYLCSRQAR